MAELLIPSQKPLPRPAKGEPEMGMNSLKAFRDAPGPDTAKWAAELLARTGPLTLDGLYYRLSPAGDVETLSKDRLDLERLRATAEEARQAAQAMVARTLGA